MLHSTVLVGGWAAAGWQKMEAEENAPDPQVVDGGSIDFLQSRATAATETSLTKFLLEYCG